MNIIKIPLTKRIEAMTNMHSCHFVWMKITEEYTQAEDPLDSSSNRSEQFPAKLSLGNLRVDKAQTSQLNATLPEGQICCFNKHLINSDQDCVRIIGNKLFVVNIRRQVGDIRQLKANHFIILFNDQVIWSICWLKGLQF
jgi:hypothetical protein